MRLDFTYPLDFSALNAPCSMDDGSPRRAAQPETPEPPVEERGEPVETYWTKAIVGARGAA